MSRVINDQELERMYENKKASCEKRLISWNLSLEEYKALYKMRSVLTCFYTDAKFNLSSSSNDNYPSLERLDGTRPYEAGNLVFCTIKVNRLKGKHIEGGASEKGIGEDAHILQRIRKVLNDPAMIEKRLQPYKEIFDKVALRKQEQEAKEIRKQEVSEACEKAKHIQALKNKADEQLALSKHYTAIMTMFDKMGLVYNLSIKQHRDVYRVTRCKISKQPFESMEDKFMWIPDKTAIMEKGVVDKEDFIVTHNNMRDVLDNLANCGNLKTIALNVLKNV